MSKHEIKVEFSNTDEIESLIERAYFIEGDRGRILSKKYYLDIKKQDDVNFTIFRDLDGVTVKITNREIIDGCMRFMIDESGGDIKLYPISIYAINEGGKYIFW
jgi:hypothetical protein